LTKRTSQKHTFNLLFPLLCPSVLFTEDSLTRKLGRREAPGVQILRVKDSETKRQDK